MSVQGAAEAMAKKRKLREATELQLFIRRIVFLNTYARIDIGVSKHRNHLLKSPFVVHPKTGKICVVFDPEEVESFDPNDVPTVRTVAEELDSVMEAVDAAESVEQDPPTSKRRKKLTSVEKTSLAPYLRYFEDKFLEPMRKDLLRAKKEALLENAAPQLSW